jgi:hypothetical protein
MIAEQLDTGRYLETRSVWRRTGDAEHPWETRVGGACWKVRVNDFPEETLYTLLIDGAPVLDLDSWPDAWMRSETAGRVAAPLGAVAPLLPGGDENEEVGIEDLTGFQIEEGGE